MQRCIDCVQAHTEADPVLDEEKLLGDEEEPSTMVSISFLRYPGMQVAGPNGTPESNG